GKCNDDDDDDDDDDVYEMPNVYDKHNQTRTKIIEDNKKIEDFTVKEIGMLLSDLNLSQYGGVFEREQVDGRILKDLEKEMLQSHFNMTPFHAHKLKKAAMENWRPTVTDRK
ncbi:GRB2-associated and regulator of MAPK 2-like isoform X4, partial [Paramuricea clavata]